MNTTNMESEKERWVEKTMGSLDGMHRAKPAMDLFDKIEMEIDKGKTKTIYFSPWRPAVAAAILLLVLNVFAIQMYAKRSFSTEVTMGTEIAYESQLVSDFKLYDE